MKDNMTRINLIPPAELMDQHLFAEFREIKMIPKSLRRSIISMRKIVGTGRADAQLVAKIPKEFTLNAGHVTFFYDKGAYLHERYAQLKAELDKRGVNYNRDSLLDPDHIMQGVWMGDYVPTDAALAIIRERIAERIALQPNFYKYYGAPINV